MPTFLPTLPVIIAKLHFPRIMTSFAETSHSDAVSEFERNRMGNFSNAPLRLKYLEARFGCIAVNQPTFSIHVVLLHKQCTTRSVTKPILNYCNLIIVLAAWKWVRHILGRSQSN